MVLLEDRNIVFTSEQKHKLIKTEADVKIFHHFSRYLLCKRSMQVH